MSAVRLMIRGPLDNQIGGGMASVLWLNETYWLNHCSSMIRWVTNLWVGCTPFFIQTWIVTRSMEQYQGSYLQLTVVITDKTKQFVVTSHSATLTIIESELFIRPCGWRRLHDTRSALHGNTIVIFDTATDFDSWPDAIEFVNGSTQTNNKRSPRLVPRFRPRTPSTHVRLLARTLAVLNLGKNRQAWFLRCSRSL